MRLLDQKGSAALEFALVAPLILFVILAGIALLWQQLTLLRADRAVEDATRCMSLHAGCSAVLPELLADLSALGVEGASVRLASRPGCTRLVAAAGLLPAPVDVLPAREWSVDACATDPL